jgi:hypothetical protein
MLTDSIESPDRRSCEPEQGAAHAEDEQRQHALRGAAARDQAEQAQQYADHSQGEQCSILELHTTTPSNVPLQCGGACDARRMPGADGIIGHVGGDDASLGLPPCAVEKPAYRRIA